MAKKSFVSYNSLSLFSWIGWHDLAQKRVFGSSMRTLGYSEIEKNAKAIYEKHFPWVPCLGDMTQIDASKLKDIDLVLASPPCTSFSQAWNMDGLNSQSGKLFIDSFKILKDSQCSYAIYENVQNLVTMEKWRIFNEIKNEANNAWYNLHYVVLSSDNFWVPQKRKRLYALLIRKDLLNQSQELINDFLALKEVNRKHKIPLKAILQQWAQEDFVPFKSKLRKSRKDFRQEKLIDINKPCTTLVSWWAKQSFIDPYYKSKDITNKFNAWLLSEYEIDRCKVRLLTPNECELVQNFPIDYTSWLSNNQRRILIWNSLIPKVVEAILKVLKKHFNPIRIPSKVVSQTQGIKTHLQLLTNTTQKIYKNKWIWVRT